MDLAPMLTFQVVLHAVVALVALPLACGWVPVNDFYGYRIGEYRSWPPETWYRVNRVFGRRLGLGAGLVAGAYALLAWWGPTVTRQQFSGMAVALVLPLVVVMGLAHLRARREAQRR